MLLRRQEQTGEVVEALQASGAVGVTRVTRVTSIDTPAAVVGRALRGLFALFDDCSSDRANRPPDG